MSEFLELNELIKESYRTFGVFGGERPKLIPTGIAPIDEKMGGIMPGSLWFVGARTNVGKSTIMLNMAFAAAEKGYTALYISGEDPEALVGGKIQSRFSGIPLVDLAVHGYSLGGDHGIRSALDRSKQFKLYTAFPQNRSLAAIKELLERSVNTIKPDVIYYDYLTTISPDMRTDVRVFYSSAVMTLRTLARNTKIPVICGSQVSRRPGEVGDNYEINKRELSETGNIENYSDVILLAWAENDGSRYMKVAKNKIAGHVCPRMVLNFDVRTEIMHAKETLDR